MRRDLRRTSYCQYSVCQGGYGQLLFFFQQASNHPNIQQSFIKIKVTATIENWVYLLFQLNLKQEVILSCQWPQDAARKIPESSPQNFPFGFCSAIKLMALAYSYENPTSTWIMVKRYVICDVITKQVVVSSVHLLFDIIDIKYQSICQNSFFAYNPPSLQIDENDLQLPYQQMIRINRLLRAVGPIHKVPVRGGPGWDRPDVPPTQKVETNTRFTHEQIIYTFFDSSMPEFFLTEPEIYEGDLIQALPQLASIWGLLLGTAFSIFLFHELLNRTRKNTVIEPVSTKYYLNQIKRINEEKVALKYSRQNPFGITVTPQMYPYEGNGKYWYPKRYYSLKASFQNLQTINKQAFQYLKGALQRAQKPHEKTHQAHHH